MPSLMKIAHGTEASESQHYRIVADEIVSAIRNCMKQIDPAQVSKFVNLLIECKKRGRKILVIGAGRSGLVARAFAMRMMHLTFTIHVVGETITPGLEKEDLLVGISGSGETTLVVTAAKIAQQTGANIVALTSRPKSPLGQIADHVVFIAGRANIAAKKDYFSRQILGVHEPLAPLGTLFELASAVFLDSLIVELMRRLGLTEEEMKKYHATIE